MSTSGPASPAPSGLHQTARKSAQRVAGQGPTPASPPRPWPPKAEDVPEPSPRGFPPSAGWPPAPKVGLRVAHPPPAQTTAHAPPALPDGRKPPCSGFEGGTAGTAGLPPPPPAPRPVTPPENPTDAFLTGLSRPPNTSGGSSPTSDGEGSLGTAPPDCLQQHPLPIDLPRGSPPDRAD
jgi:hypothetical protein